MKNKRILATILGACTVMTTGATVFANTNVAQGNTNKTENIRVLASNNKTQIGTVIGNGLNVRATASVSGARVGLLPRGAKVNITGKTGNWYSISYNGKTAYVSADYVKTGDVAGNTNQNNEITVKTGIVTGNGLNVRATASTSGARVGLLPRGAKVDITGKIGNWYSISYNGKTAYVSADYVKIGEVVGNTNQNNETTVKTGIVTGNGLNVRATASASGERVGLLPRGAKVDITGKIGNWYSISYNGKTAYVSADYVKTGDVAGNINQNNATTVKSGVVTANGLNVRNTSGAKVGLLPRGAKVNITGKIGNWYSISYNGKTAYVSADYVQIGNVVGNTNQNNGATAEVGIVIGNGLKVRDRASVTGEKVGLLPRGARVNITGKTGNWYSILYNGKIAYISADYVVLESGNSEINVSDQDLNYALRLLWYSYGDINVMNRQQKINRCIENKDLIKKIYKEREEDKAINAAGPSEESKNNPLDNILREKGYPQSVIVKLTESQKQQYSQYEGNYRQHWGEVGWPGVNSEE